MNITDDDVEKAFNFLAKSDVTYGGAIAHKLKCERLLKSTLALTKQQSNEKSNVAKEDVALVSQAYKDAVSAEFEAVKALEVLKAQRASAALRIEIWRTIGANRRRA